MISVTKMSKGWCSIFTVEQKTLIKLFGFGYDSAHCQCDQPDKSPLILWAPNYTESVRLQGIGWYHLGKWPRMNQSKPTDQGSCLCTWHTCSANLGASECVCVLKCEQIPLGTEMVVSHPVSKFWKWQQELLLTEGLGSKPSFLVLMQVAKYIQILSWFSC